MSDVFAHDPPKDNVVIGPGRLDATAIAELKKRRFLREQESHVELQPVGPGESMIGTLTTEERMLFTEMATLRDEIDEQQKELQARGFEMVAAAVRKSEMPEDILKNLDDAILFPSEEEAKAFYALETRYQYLRALYDMSVRERYGHHAAYGVRSGFTVVRIAYKYKLPDELKRL